MGSTAEPTPALSFPRDTFAKLTPGPFLLAHLKQQPPVRANGRRPDDFRPPTINTGSLTHSNGSAVVRMGDTAVVCAVRGEILLASDIPHPPKDDLDDDQLVEELGLVVPNLELSTGCSPAHLPGNPPSSRAQSLSYRISTLIHESGIINVDDLRVQYERPKTEDDIPDEESFIVTKAYWTLYVDILCLALDGNALDAAWLAVVAALRDTKLPRAWWDQNEETILCSPLASQSCTLGLRGTPLVASFAVYTTASPLKSNDDAQSWILADPDSFEEDLCGESLMIAMIQSETGGMVVLKAEKSGGAYIGKTAMRRCIAQVEQRWATMNDILMKG